MKSIGIISIILIVLFMILAPAKGCSQPSYDGMAQIPAGNFFRGACNENSKPSCEPGDPGYAAINYPDFATPAETPMATIYLDAFYIDINEVTVEDYQACLDAKACRAQHMHEYSPTFNFCNYGAPDRLNHPMNCVDWDGAHDYCRYVGKRLPSEAEWEKASRGSSGWRYPWGNKVPDCTYANFHYTDDSYGTDYYCQGMTTPAGHYPKGESPYGLNDMSGNVFEWVNDWYDAMYYTHSPTKNPQGPSSGNYKVVKGGGWDFLIWGLRSSFRGKSQATCSEPDCTAGFYNNGFRCAAEVPQRAAESLPKPGTY
jgi:formylglycine-generating enzyme required for sulfatase activity